MDIMIGIDTGGTYTDGVVFECATQKLLRSVKVATTKHNLIEGIENCLEKLKINVDEVVNKVCLSTTLATNAVVENRGARVGLIVIGPNENNNYPAEKINHVNGMMTINGRETESISEDEIKIALDGMKDDIEVLAVSGYASVRNPLHELHVKKIAEEILSVPVICAHELTSSLGFIERTITVVLNAKLIPIIKELISATKNALKKRGITSTLVVVKGDGHLMVDSFAENYPIETVTSGPAASIIGGQFLTQKKDAVIIDIGGTTTDISFINKGSLTLEPEGALIAGWRTRVKSVKVNTFGLGGNSHIYLNSMGELRVGPDRVVSLSEANEDAPYLVDEIEQYRNKNKHVVSKYQEFDCLKLLKQNKINHFELSRSEKNILENLKNGAHSMIYLSQLMNCDIEESLIEKLIEMELIQLISMTPTDLLHAKGEFICWKNAAALQGVEIMASHMEIDKDQFILDAENELIDSFCVAIIESAIRTDDIVKDNDTVSCDLALSMVKNLTDREQQKHFSCVFSLIDTIIGIGAPASVWIPKIGNAIHAQTIIPSHYEVANAIGTVVGDAEEKLDALIVFDPHINKFIAHLPNERRTFSALNSAKKETREAMDDCCKKLAKKMMLDNYKTNIEETDYYTNCIEEGDDIFIKTVITGTISGKL